MIHLRSGYGMGTGPVDSHMKKPRTTAHYCLTISHTHIGTVGLAVIQSHISAKRQHLVSIVGFISSSFVL